MNTTERELLHAPAPTEQADERSAFEAWWMIDVPEEHRVFAKKLLDGYGPDYTAAAGVADAWRTWKAARATAPQTGVSAAWLVEQHHRDSAALRRLCAERDQVLKTIIKHADDLIEVMRMPNIEYVADAHTEAVRAIRALKIRAERGE